jgi:sarcosine reductase
MKLEMVTFPVKDVGFGRTTHYHQGRLEINKNELIALVLEDKKLAYADLEVAFPGEQTRIAFVRDVVEPRIKVAGPGCIFPGILGPIETVGSGMTHRLSGVAVVSSAQYNATITTGTVAESRALIDMWGPAAKVSPYGSLINIVLIMKLVDGLSELEAHTSIQLANFRVSRRLAEATVEKVSEDIEIFELNNVDPSLPKVVYNICFHVDPWSPISRLFLYGFPVREGLPLLIHPNEFLDGSVTVDARQGGVSFWQTWAWMNQPMVLGLLRDHGKRLNFLGVILQRTSFYTEIDKQATAVFASQVAKLLGAEGAILTGIPFIGNTFFGVMQTLQAYEKKGIKTVLLTPEASGGGTGGSPLVYIVPEATAMVSTGDLQRNIDLLKPNRVIGCAKGQLMAETPEEVPLDPWEEMKSKGYSAISGSVDTWGRTNLTVKEY